MSPPPCSPHFLPPLWFRFPNHHHLSLPSQSPTKGPLLGFPSSCDGQRTRRMIFSKLGCYLTRSARSTFQTVSFVPSLCFSIGDLYLREIERGSLAHDEIWERQRGTRVSEEVFNFGVFNFSAFRFLSPHGSYYFIFKQKTKIKGPLFSSSSQLSCGS